MLAYTHIYMHYICDTKQFRNYSFSSHGIIISTQVFILDDTWRLLIGPLHSDETSDAVPYAQTK